MPGLPVTAVERLPHAIPLALQWALALFAALLGLAFILRTEGVIRLSRRWFLMQLRWLRRPSFRRFIKGYGWLLFVCGLALVVLLLIGPRR